MNDVAWLLFFVATFVAVGVTLRLVRPHEKDHLHPLRPERFPYASDEELQTAADRALLIHLDESALAAAAHEMARRSHPQTVPYLLHALRRNATRPAVAGPLLDALTVAGADPVAAQRQLVGDLPHHIRDDLASRLGVPLQGPR